MIAAPSPSSVERMFEELLAGRLSREEADRWAAHWVCAPVPPQMHPVIWRALTRLFGCDLRHASGADYLHDDEQIAQWLAEFREDSQ